MAGSAAAAAAWTMGLLLLLGYTVGQASEHRDDEDARDEEEVTSRALSPGASAAVSKVIATFTGRPVSDDEPPSTHLSRIELVKPNSAGPTTHSTEEEGTPTHPSASAHGAQHVAGRAAFHAHPPTDEDLVSHSSSGRMPTTLGREAPDEETPTTHSPNRPHVGRSMLDGRCSASDDRDCPLDAATSDHIPDFIGDVRDRRLNSLLHGKPLVPDEENGDFGFLYARSLSLSVDEDMASTSPSVRGRALRNRVFGQTWCSASSCPVSAALTLTNTTARQASRKIGQGEAVVACLDCSFSAASVSIVDGGTVCAAAISSNMPKGVCLAVCQWEGLDYCTCASGCSSVELGSDSVHSYAYQVTASSGPRDLLAYLHRLMVRVHNTAEHLNIASLLDVPARTRQIKANVEKRFGKEKAKSVPLLSYNNNAFR